MLEREDIRGDEGEGVRMRGCKRGEKARVLE